MPYFTLVPFVMWIVALIVVARSVKIVRESERIAIYRLGRFQAVRGPGLVMVVPIVDKVDVVDLNQSVPGWQGLPPAEIAERVRTVSLSRGAT